MQIIPAILSVDKFEVFELLRKIRESGKFERVQIDFIDGEYANNKTIRPVEVDLLPFLPLMFDAHLMVTENNVLAWSKTAEKVGFDRVIVQTESISNPGDFSGLALDIHSPVELLIPYLHNLDVVVLMAVEPGFSGQKFNDGVIEKVRQLHKLRRYSNYRYKICVDGGVLQEHVPILSEAGADEVTVGIRRALDWS
jgi:ribulose-phosphate 3-epimerase